MRAKVAVEFDDVVGLVAVLLGQALLGVVHAHGIQTGMAPLNAVKELIEHRSHHERNAGAQ